MVFHHTPVSVSLGFFAQDGAIDYVLDPTEREEMVMAGGLTVVINQHQEVCAMQKPGGVPIEGVKLMECMQRAAAAAPQVLLVLEQVLEEHARKLAEAAETLRKTGRTQKAMSSTMPSGEGHVVPNGNAPAGTSSKKKQKLK